jgi:putative peptidoglycan lipid II flippase
LSLQKAAGTVSAATFLSRIFGLVRDQLFAALLGAGYYADAFVAAFRIPNLLRDLFAEGALSSAFVPTFAELEVKKSAEDAYRLANLVIGAILALVGSIALLGILFAPAVVRLVAPGFSAVPGKVDLTVTLTRLMFPFLPTVALASLFMGMLNVKGKFAVPALAPVMFNIVSILFGLALWLTGASPAKAVVGWSVGTLCGGIAQMAIQIPPLLELGWRWRPTIRRWKEDESLRQIGKLMIPAVIGLSATQVNILVNTLLASNEQGSVAWLNYAFRLMQLPIGIFGVAISTITLPLIARDAAKASKEDFQNNLTTALSLVLVLTIPAAVGLWVMGEPIIRVIYEHGKFQDGDTFATAGALAMYAIGLPAYASVKVVAPAFYALKDSKAPMVASFLAMGANLAFNLSMYKSFGFRGLAFGTSIAATTNLAFLIFSFHFDHAKFDLRVLIDRLWRILLASGVMAVIAMAVYLQLHVTTNSITLQLVETLVPIFLATVAYFLLLAWLNVPEASLVGAFVKKIYGRFFSR